MKSRVNRISTKLTEAHAEFADVEYASTLRFLDLPGLKVYLDATRLSISSILDKFSEYLCSKLANI